MKRVVFVEGEISGDKRDAVVYGSHRPNWKTRSGLLQWVKKYSFKGSSLLRIFKYRTPLPI